MKNIGVLLLIALVSLAICFGLVSNVHSQDLFRDMDQVKRELADLKNEVSLLRNLVYSLREVVLKSVTAQDQGKSEKTPTIEKKPLREETPAKPEPVVDEKEVTRAVCQAVGKFFVEADAAMRTGRDSAAEPKMREAFQKMNASLRKYAGTHRVSKLLNIYEGLAWDTYVAVELRGATQGNEEFIEALNRHKRKFRETCPRE